MSGPQKNRSGCSRNIWKPCGGGGFATHYSGDGRNATVFWTAARQAYQKAVERVRKLLVQLAPELMQDLSEPVHANLNAIEAIRRIAAHEHSAEVASLKNAIRAQRPSDHD